jgi:FkbM family methyltransferase
MIESFKVLAKRTIDLGLATSLKVSARRLIGSKKEVSKDGLIIRPHESDPQVFAQVFGARHHFVGERRTQQLRALMTQAKKDGRVPVIIDGGANVGYSPIFFSRTYPDATVIAVEPDPATFGIMRRNCEGYANIKLVHGALWKDDNGVTLTNTDDEAWGRTVQGTGAVASYTIESLLSLVPNADPIIIKLDIEGSEAEVGDCSSDTLRACPCVVVEPHDWMFPDRNTLMPFFKTFAGRPTDSLIHGQNIIFFDTGKLNSV